MKAKTLEIGKIGYPRGLKARFVRWLLRGAKLEELHIGAHSIVIDGDKIKLNALAADPATPAEGWLWWLAGTTHKLSIHDGTEVKRTVFGPIATADISDGAVTEAKIAAGAVATAKIADLAVTAAKIADGAVATAKLAANAVDSTKIADGAVATAKIAAGAVDSTKIADLAVVTGKIADGAVATAKIADGAVTGPKVATNAVLDTPKIKDVDATPVADATLKVLDENFHFRNGADTALTQIFASQGNFGDVVFANGWRLTEHDEHGLVLQNERGEKFAFSLTRIE